MCGIAGFTTFRHAPPDPRATLAAMLATLRHRGPDGEGLLLTPAVALGHRRLSILDHAGGAQPMSTPDGHFHVIQNGEIYNDLALRESLARRQRPFITHADSESILQSYADAGPAGLRTLEGMFAFALWDDTRQRLLLARDPMGIKPLFYSCIRGELVFASELQALLAFPGVSPTIAVDAVATYLALGCIPPPRTIYANICKLEPGTLAHFTRQGLHLEPLAAQPPAPPPPAGPPPSAARVAAAANELLTVLSAAVGRHLRSDVPLGVLLSGGLDSSLLAALATRQARRDLPTFSIGFEISSYDESRHAAAAAARLGTRHHHAVFTASDAAASFMPLMQHLDEPLADPSLLPTAFLCRFAAQHVKVVLGGDGADELFGGYPAFPAQRLLAHLDHLPLTARSSLAAVLQRLPVTHRYASAGFLLGRAAAALRLPPDHRYTAWFGALPPPACFDALSPDARAALQHHPAAALADLPRLLAPTGITGPQERLLHLTLRLYLQCGILTKLDRASMAASIEARVPYLDHAVVALASSWPASLKLPGLTTKPILKQAAASLLPPSIIQRRKAGFMMPVAAWLNASLQPLVADLTAPASLAATGLLNPAFVQRLVREHATRRRDHRRTLWPLLTLLAWLQTHPA